MAGSEVGDGILSTYTTDTMFVSCHLLQFLHQPLFFSTQAHLKTLSIISK